MQSRTPKKSKSALPRPTPSEAAFERALASLAMPSAVTPSVPRLATLARDDGRSRGADALVTPSEAPKARSRGADVIAASFVARAFAEREKYLDRDQYASIGGADAFHTKIVGVSFEDRQDVVAGLQVGYELDIVRDPENPKDPNAIAVRYGNLHLGFIRAAIAKHLAAPIDAGAGYRARVASLTGGGERHRGVNIFVWRSSNANAPTDAVRARAQWEGDAERIRAALIGEHQPHTAQREVLARIDAGKNTLALLGTGRGKSFCFQLPAAVRALALGHKTLVIYPLRALANDQHDALVRKLDPFGLRIHRANGSISPEEREDLFAALRDGTWDIVLATPEFVEYHRDAFVGQSVPQFIVVDEAHHLFESKHRPAYGKLGRTIASFDSSQVLALTATAADDAFAHVVRELRIDAWVIDPTVRDNLHVIDARGKKDKIGYLGDLLAPDDDGKAIVYCMSRSEAQKVADALRKRLGDIVMFYHAGMPTADRLQVEQFFRAGALRVVVATSAFGEGIDLPDVRHVVLYHLNFDFTTFNQQAGRAGRDGGPADIHLLFGEADRRINDYIIDRTSPTLPVLRELYRGMRGLARDGVLRMTHVDVARTLDLDKADERTVSAALRIFEDASLLEIGFDDDGRFTRFLNVDGKVDLTQNERYAEGEAERESFAQFAALALSAKADALQRIVNRPIYPEREPLKAP
jgi:single-stranded-DNA-specific exonuclease